jgi:hypothetical protein
VADGTPPAAAATYLAGWFGGIVASSVGYALAGSGAWFVVDPDRVRWTLDPSGHWPEAVWLGGATALLPPGHVWTGRPGTRVVADVGERRRRAADAVRRAVDPIIGACHGLARVGRVGLWNEVADGFVGGVVDAPEVRADEAMLAELLALANLSGSPWRGRSVAYLVGTELGPICVMRKGGCCLAFTVTPTADEREDELDEDDRSYLRRFPEGPDDPGYCSNCVRRTVPDCEARQVWWRLRERRREVASEVPG